MRRASAQQLFTSRRIRFQLQVRHGKPARKMCDGSRNVSGKRIIFAKFFDIVYILSFHCTVVCRVKALRGTGKTHSCSLSSF